MSVIQRRELIQAAGLAIGGLGLNTSTAALAKAGSGPSSASSSAIQLWEDFCREIAATANVLKRPKAPTSALDQIEGIRYLSRLTRGALEMAVESGDPDFPRFYQLSNEVLKIGADNPDNIYHNATISGDRSYRVIGHKGTVPYLSFGTKANRYAIDGTMASTGELDGRDMTYNDDGTFELIVSKERGSATNWISLSDDSSILLVRQTFLDKSVEIPAKLTIECLNGPAVPEPLTEEKLAKALKDTAAFVRGTSKTFAEWTELFMSRPNELLPWDQSFFQRGGGDPNIHYLHGYWDLKPNQAWVLKTAIPKCRMWNFQADNWWMESLDYRTRPNVWTNSKKARLDADGSLTLVISPKDLGFGTWIDTAGHLNGTALLRWINAETHPVPTAEIISI
jgi:hypothetical protein